MKKISVIILAIATLCSCALHKDSNQVVKHVLYSEYNEFIDGDITFTVVNDNHLNCDTNHIIVEISSIRPENTNVSGSGVALSRVNQPENHYLLMPFCKGKPYLSISYRNAEGKYIMLVPMIDLKQFM